MSRGVCFDAAELRRQIGRRGWSQADLSKQAGITENTVIRMMRGQAVQLLSYRRVMQALRAEPPLDDGDAALPPMAVEPEGQQRETAA